MLKRSTISRPIVSSILVSILISFFSFSVFAAGTTAIEVKQPALAAPVESAQVYKIAQGKIRVAIDPRIELLSVVRMLSGRSENGRQAKEMRYRDDVLAYFDKFKGHRAVSSFAKLFDSNFNYDAFPNLMILFSAPPELSQNAPYTDYLIKRARGKEALDVFMKDLRDFARESDFMKFFGENGKYYEKVVAATVLCMDGKNDADTMEKYFGMKQGGYNIILAQILRGGGGYGARLSRDDKTFDIYNIAGPEGVGKDGLPFFGSPESFRQLIWHEFGHSFVNPACEKLAAEVVASSTLLAPIADKMTKQAYPDWETCVNEHIIRAVCARLSALESGDDRALEELIRNRTNGFVYIDFICELLKKYEGDRVKYKTFADFCPVILTALAELADKKPSPEFFKTPFYGPINSVFDIEGKTILVLPTAEADKSAEAALLKGIEKIKNSFFKDAVTMTDIEALKADISDSCVIAYGSAKGNLWIEKFLRDMPVAIGDGSIELDKKYEGKNLRLITAWRNPKNIEKGVVIYTAFNTADVIAINGIFHGPTDYVIADGKKILASGYYKNKKGNWKAK